MCGIVGAIGQRNVVPILVEGLKRLEYRGYDSAGIAVLRGGLETLRTTERVAVLDTLARSRNVQGQVGIAHTRWATHGAPSERNAHPHVSRNRIAVVHNGIIENHDLLRKRLQDLGYEIVSDTDTEVIAHLVDHYYTAGTSLFAAVERAVKDLEGAYAIGVLSHDLPDQLICARRGSPLLIGVGIEEHFIASDVAALLPVTQEVIILEDGDVAALSRLSRSIHDGEGRPVEREVRRSNLRPDAVELGEYRHFMQKEIHEQPRAISDTLAHLQALRSLTPALFGELADRALHDCEGVTLLACGTSLHAARVAQYWLEEIAGIPATAEVASEYRYRKSVANPKHLVVVISQSGETADTLAALEHAKRLGHPYTLAVCNVAESSLVRATGMRFMTHAGPEIGVASTKAFTTQLVALLILTLTIAKLRGNLDTAAEAEALGMLRSLPEKVAQVLAIEPEVARWAEKLTDKHHALFLGRGVHYPIAMEGALKLKEISYIHAEAYPAGELKHGPLALVDADMPVIAIAPNDALLEKLKSNLEEVRARGGQLYVFAAPDSAITAQDGISVIKLPTDGTLLSPILQTLPLQMLAYHAALNKGTDVDKPRNLAKSVTVE